MATLPTTVPTIGDDVTPTFTTCTASDKFSATGGKFILYYKNGAGGAVTSAYALNTATAPAGTFPGPGSGGTNWADLRLTSAIPISTDAVCVIPDAAPYVDATNFVNLKHTGIAGPLTVAVVGPL